MDSLSAQEHDRYARKKHDHICSCVEQAGFQWEAVVDQWLGSFVTCNNSYDNEAFDPIIWPIGSSNIRYFQRAKLVSAWRPGLQQPIQSYIQWHW